MAVGKKTGGRQKGTLNKVNADLKDMIQSALNKAGGEEYLYQQALENPAAFLTLIGKILPKDINASIAGSLTLHSTVELVRANNPDT